MNDIRKALEEAYDESEEESGGSGATDSSESVGSTEKVVTPGEIIEGEITSKTVDSGERDKDAKTVEKEETDLTSADGEDKKRDEAEVIKPPAGWSPEAREVFKDLSPVAQKEIVKREKDYAVGLQRNAEAGKFGTQVKDVLAPFQAIMRMEGVDEVAAVRGLATTAATLRMGTPTEKASEIARLIKGYGVDIVTLDDILSGQFKEVPDEERRMTALLDKHLAPVRGILEEVQRGKAEVGQQVIAKVDEEIAAFEAEAEFINEVKEDMADFLEIAAKNGRKLTLKEAYDKAVALQPSLQKIIDERNRVSRLKEEQKRLSGKRLAATSVHGASVGSGNTYTPGVNIKSDIEMAWEEAEQR